VRKGKEEKREERKGKSSDKFKVQIQAQVQEAGAKISRRVCCTFLKIIDKGAPLFFLKTLKILNKKGVCEHNVNYSFLVYR